MQTTQSWILSLFILAACGATFGQSASGDETTPNFISTVTKDEARATTHGDATPMQDTDATVTSEVKASSHVPTVDVHNGDETTVSETITTHRVTDDSNSIHGEDTPSNDKDNTPRANNLSYNEGDGVTNNDSGANAGAAFPWWTLLLVLLATVVIIVAIAVPFYLYNRKMTHRQAVVAERKRASEVLVESWGPIPTTDSSIPPTPDSADSISQVDLSAGQSQENILIADVTLPDGIV